MVQQIKYVLRNFRLQNDDKTLLCNYQEGLALFKMI
jgi:hypothetical protein